MKGRVTWNGINSSIALDWPRLVDKPVSEGYFVEAFSSADALIDSQIENLLLQVYNSSLCQDLIFNLESMRDDTKFFGSGILNILEKINVVGKSLGNKIKAFKGKRNKVSHNPEGEYSLVNPTDPDLLASQQAYDQAVEKEAKKHISHAFEAFLELCDLNSALAEKFKNISKDDKERWLRDIRHSKESISELIKSKKAI